MRPPRAAGVALGCLWSLASSAQAAEAPKPSAKSVAVLEFENQLGSGEPVDRVYFSDKVRGELKRRRPELQVMTRENIVQLLTAAGKKLEDCVGQCEVESGRLLGADLVVSGRLTKVGTRYKLTLRFHDTRAGTLLSSATASGDTVNQLDDSTSAAVQELVDPLTAPRPTEVAPAPGPKPAGPVTRPEPAPAAPPPSVAMPVEKPKAWAAPLALSGLVLAGVAGGVTAANFSSTQDAIGPDTDSTGNGSVLLGLSTGFGVFFGALPLFFQTGTPAPVPVITLIVAPVAGIATSAAALAGGISGRDRVWTSACTAHVIGSGLLGVGLGLTIRGIARAASDDLALRDPESPEVTPTMLAVPSPAGPALVPGLVGRF